MRYGIIYKVTSPSGKVYIGKTVMRLSYRKKSHKCCATNKRYKTYNCKFYKAMRKYGSLMKWEIIHSSIPEDNLNDLEVKEIENHNSYKHGYNSTLGGEGASGVKPSKETRKKMSKAHSGKNNGFFGKKHTLKSKERMSSSSKGKANWRWKDNAEALAKISGENCYMSKLTFDIAKEIRRKYASGKYSYSVLAKEYNVGKSTIYRVIKNKSWGSKKSNEY